MINDLFNVEVKENKTNKERIALVYRDSGIASGQVLRYRKSALTYHLENEDIDLDKVEIIPMENSRILGDYPSNTFRMVYYGDDITLGVYKELEKRFINLQWYEI